MITRPLYRRGPAAPDPETELQGSIRGKDFRVHLRLPAARHPPNAGQTPSSVKTGDRNPVPDRRARPLADIVNRVPAGNIGIPKLKD